MAAGETQLADEALGRCAEPLTQFQGGAGWLVRRGSAKKSAPSIMEPSAATHRPVILLVDDNPHDVVLTRLAFRKAGIIDTIKLVKDGAEAMQYLSGQDIYADRQLYPVPTLLLLDLNMPHTSGFDVLGWVKAQPFPRKLYVVVMSNSKENRDIEQAYALGADAYLVKPSRLSDLVGMMKSIKETCLNPGSKQQPLAGDSFAPPFSPGGLAKPPTPLRAADCFSASA
jgi:CheY-like chemotaxis protein